MSRVRPVVLPVLVAAMALLSGTTAAAPQVPSAAVATDVRDTAALSLDGRTVTVFRSALGAATASERVAAAADRILARMRTRGTDSVGTQADPAGILLTLGGAPMFILTPSDIVTERGETLESRAASAGMQMRDVIDVENETHSVPRLLRAAAICIFSTLIFLLLLRVLVLGQRALLRRLPVVRRAGVVRNVAVGGFTLLRADQMVQFLRRTTTVILTAVGLIIAYLWLTFVLTRFAYSRPWGQALGGYLLHTLRMIALGVLHAIPGLFTIVLIFAITRTATRLVRAFFDAVESRSVEAPWIHPETANPTRRIVVAMMWMFALVVAYPYFPGSSSDVFKGVSVFAGVVLSLGSSGVMSQGMSGLVLMYARALRPGDYVRIGETEGVVTELGMLSTKIRTTKREEVTIPNAVVVGATVKNYSRLASEAEGVLLYTSVTIGYDTPWRQVHAMLIEAVGSTDGLRNDPPPFVLQTALSDFYIEYQLNCVLEDPVRRPSVLSSLHANIVDTFNNYGVQITSPHYIADPPEPIVVPREKWYTPPA